MTGKAAELDADWISRN